MFSLTNIRKKSLIFSTLLVLLILTIIPFVSSETTQEKDTCIYFFYGVSCPHCAEVEPLIEQIESKYQYLEVHKFEIYINRSNAELLNKYFDVYNVPSIRRGIPVIFISDKALIGDKPIINNLENEIINNKGATCPKLEEEKPQETKLTIPKLISLATVDAVNPCALAVLALMLIAILTYNPKKKKNVLLAGLAFTLSVFVMYLIYGLIIIKFFQLVQALTAIRLWLYNILGFGAILLGILNIKDFFKYKPGSLGTEMPLFMRPKIKKMISGVTSPKGAFIVGLFVTLFLLPCTIGPYIIAGGILSALELIKTLPFLLLYNIIFVLPMLVITLIVYAGVARVEDVSGWKDKNIRNLHLIAGIIMLVLGIAMVIGLV